MGFHVSAKEFYAIKSQIKSNQDDIYFRWNLFACSVRVMGSEVEVFIP